MTIAYDRCNTLKGSIQGKKYDSCRMDGNNQIVSIAFGICKGETGPCCSWLMYVLKECIGDNPNLLFISDRHAAIAFAVQDEFPLAYHAVCCRHLMMNLSLKRDKTKALFWRICKAYTIEEFSRSMSHLQDIQTDAYDKLCQVGPHRWSRLHFLLVRYTYLTSNSVESVNACTVVYRKLPVLKLAETYRAMVQEWVAGKIQLFVSHHQIDLSTVLIPNDGSLEEALEENVRLSVLAKLQEALDEKDILADQILTMMHRYADRFTNRRVEINNLMVLQDHPLVDYGKYTLGCMTGAGMKKCVHLKSVRGELLRSMEEKRQLMANYKDM
uniref:Transposase, MuDR, MULE transposase domain protein n=1 Tax=Tanacetum cinerariifolium TaxID=118510 RepID=A0A699HYM9_TANCI|nr:transposase, MuDR, MULE transposase domain protein [Tanacetum cinerariifolium]